MKNRMNSSLSSNHSGAKQLARKSFGIDDLCLLSLSFFYACYFLNLFMFLSQYIKKYLEVAQRPTPSLLQSGIPLSVEIPGQQMFLYVSMSVLRRDPAPKCCTAFLFRSVPSTGTINFQHMSDTGNKMAKFECSLLTQALNNRCNRNSKHCSLLTRNPFSSLHSCDCNYNYLRP